MNLRTVHQVFIVAAGALAAIFALRSFVLFARGGGALPLVLGLVSAAVGVGAGVYFKRFRAKLRAAAPTK